MDQSQIKNFNFSLLSEFGGYDSTLDPTKCSPNFMTFGSQNIYKKINGNLAVRPGMKLRGALNATNSPISSEYVWNTSWGDTRVLIVSEGQLQVEYNDVYYSLLTTAQTRFVFDMWGDITTARDKLIFVDGTTDLFSWTGGMTQVSSVVS